MPLWTGMITLKKCFYSNSKYLYTADKMDHALKRQSVISEDISNECTIVYILSVAFRFPATSTVTSTCLSPVCCRWAVFTSGCPTWTVWRGSWKWTPPPPSRASIFMEDTHTLCKTTLRNLLKHKTVGGVISSGVYQGFYSILSLRV